ADEIEQELCVYVHTAFVFSQISLVVSFQEDLNVGLVRAQRMHEGLKYRYSILGSISLLSKRGESKSVSCAISQVELAVGLYALILGVGQTPGADATIPSNSLRDARSTLRFPIFTRLSSSALPISKVLLGTNNKNLRRF